MKIQYLGHSCFRLEAQGTSVVTDPYGDVGFALPQLTADAVTVSHFHYDHCNVQAVSSPRVISAAGEYTVGAFRIIGKERAHDEAGGRKRGKTVAFRFEAEGLSLLHLGDVGEPCSEALFADLGRADVLLLPVGGNYTIGGEEAARYVKRFRPAFAIPMHFMQKGLTVDIGGPEPFLRRFANVERVGDCVEITPRMCGETRIFYMERRK